MQRIFTFGTVSLLVAGALSNCSPGSQASNTSGAAGHSGAGATEAGSGNAGNPSQNAPIDSVEAGARDGGSPPSDGGPDAEQTDAQVTIEPDSEAPATVRVDGTLESKPVATVDAYTTLLTFENKQGTKVTNSFHLAVVDYANACALEQSYDQKATSSNFSIFISATNAERADQPPAIRPGTYAFELEKRPIPDAEGNVFETSAYYVSSDAQCHVIDFYNFATKGTLSITSVSGVAVAGSFDLTFKNADRLTGTFNTPLCSVVPDANAPVECVE